MKKTMLLSVLGLIMSITLLGQDPLCDRWIAKPKTQKKYIEWLTERGQTAELIALINDSNVPADKRSKLQQIKKEYNDNVINLNLLIDDTKKAINEYDPDKKIITESEIKKLITTIKGHNNLLLNDDYAKTLANVRNAKNKMKDFYLEMNMQLEAPAFGADDLLAIFSILINNHQDRETRKLDCLKWSKWD